MSIEILPLTPRFGTLIRGERGALTQLDWVQTQERLRRTGAILFEGFEADVAEFEDASRRFEMPFVVHQGLGREIVSEDRATQTVAPGTTDIPPHIERGYMPPLPSLIFFYCDVPAAARGETTLYDGAELLESMSPAVRRLFVENRLRWHMIVPPQGWAQTYGTTDQEVVAQKVAAECRILTRRDAGERVRTWFENDFLHYDYVVPAVVPCGRGGGLAFSNSALSYFHSWQNEPWIELFFEDGRPFPMEPLAEAMERAKEIVYEIKWRHGDFAVVDNITVMHGRNDFTDLGRRVYGRIAVPTAA